MNWLAEQWPGIALGLAIAFIIVCMCFAYTQRYAEDERDHVLSEVQFYPYEGHSGFSRSMRSWLSSIERMERDFAEIRAKIELLERRSEGRS